MRSRDARMIGAAMALAMLSPLGSGFAHADAESRTITYIATSMWFSHEEFLTGLVRAAGGPDVTPLGNVTLSPTQSRIVLRFNDSDPLALIYVVSDRGHQACIPNAEEFELAGLTAGQDVQVHIWSGLLSREKCGDQPGATVGTLTVTF